MSYANGTQNYNLPQTVGTDKRDWFDTNAAFAAVDAALHAAVTGQAADAEAISTINASLATDEANIAALQTASTSQAASISTLQTTVNAQAAQIADVRQDAEDMITANNEGAAATSTRAYSIGDYFIYNDVLYKATAAIAVGDTIVPNTNCEATNVDTEITAVKSDLPEFDHYLAKSTSTDKVIVDTFGNLATVSFDIIEAFTANQWTEIALSTSLPQPISSELGSVFGVGKLDGSDKTCLVRVVEKTGDNYYTLAFEFNENLSASDHVRGQITFTKV